MVILGRRARKSLEALRNYAQNRKLYPRGRQLAAQADGSSLLYEINPVYIEVGQGFNSPMRGVGVAVYLAMGVCAIWFGIQSIWEIIQAWRTGNSEEVDLFGLVLAIVLLVLAYIPGLLVAVAFFAPTDLVVRLDRKRQVAWLWNAKEVITVPWASLTPAVQGMATSPHMPGRTYRGVYAEYGEDGKPKVTGTIAHSLAAGPVTGDEQGALITMEYLRRYMEEDYAKLPSPGRLLRHRPGWQAMFNFIGMLDNKQEEVDGQFVRSKVLRQSDWMSIGLFVGFFPFMFFMQVTNWLALKVAPLPKWPKTMLEAHAKDLAEFGSGRDARSLPALGHVRRLAATRGIAMLSIVLALIGAMGPWVLFLGLIPHWFDISALYAVLPVAWIGGGLAVALAWNTLKPVTSSAQ